MEVYNTGEALKIPVGKEVLGRAFDIFALPHDQLGEVKSKTWRPLFAPRQRQLKDVTNTEKIIETGVKVIEVNLSCPNVANEGIVCYSKDAVLSICKKTKEKYQCS